MALMRRAATGAGGGQQADEAARSHVSFGVPGHGPYSCPTVSLLPKGVPGGVRVPGLGRRKFAKVAWEGAKNGLAGGEAEDVGGAVCGVWAGAVAVWRG